MPEDKIGVQIECIVIGEKKERWITDAPERFRCARIERILKYVAKL